MKRSRGEEKAQGGEEAVSVKLAMSVLLLLLIVLLGQGHIHEHMIKACVNGAIATTQSSVCVSGNDKQLHRQGRV